MTWDWEPSAVYRITDPKEWRKAVFWTEPRGVLGEAELITFSGVFDGDDER